MASRLTKVTDPELLRLLNEEQQPNIAGTKVTDPELLKQLQGNQAFNPFQFNALQNVPPNTSLRDLIAPILPGMRKTVFGGLPEPKRGQFAEQKDIEELIPQAFGLTGALPQFGQKVAKPLAMGLWDLRHAADSAAPQQAAALAAQTAHTAGLGEQATAQEQAILAGVPQEPVAIHHKILENENKLNQLQEDLQAQPPVLPHHVEQAETNIGNLERNQEQAQTQAQTHIANLERIQQQAQNIQNQSMENINHYLQPNIEHDVLAARRINEIESANRRSIGQSFQNREQRWRDTGVTVNNNAEIQRLTQQLSNLISRYQGHTPEALDIATQLERLRNSGGQVNAADMLHTYQSLSQFEREATNMSFRPGLNKEDRLMWQERAAELRTQVNNLGNRLEEAVGPEEMQGLRNDRRRWATEVAPLYRNSIYRKIENKSQMSPNIMNNLRGDDPGDVIIRNIIQNDPELTRLVIGERFKQPHGQNQIFNPNSRMQSYLDRDPQLRQMIAHHNEANQYVHEAGERLNNANEAATQTAHQAQERIAEAQEEHKAISQNVQAYEAKLSQINKVRDDLQKLEQHRANLQKHANRTGVNLEQKVKAENELKKVSESIAKARKKLKYAGGALLGYGALKTGYNALTNLLSQKGQ
jgi:hypothetical protein